jgi:small subunit ribosomal protein S20
VANHKSSEKRARSSERKRQRNSNYLSSVRTAVKKYRFALNGLSVGTGEEAAKVRDLLAKAQSALSKAAAKGLLHKNNAARSIARLTQAFKGLEKTGVAASATSKPKAKATKSAAKKPAAKKTAAKKAAAKSTKTKK